jgi:hypothetical protein
VLTHDIRPAYECLRSALKLLQWKSPAQHWNLKNPPDLFSLDAVDAVFPEATFVWIHRDPGVAIASLASLLELQRRGGVDGIDRRRLMESCLSLQAVGVERGLAARERIGERRFVDVREEDLERDPVALVRNLYSRLGLPFSPEFEASLRTRLTARPRGADGRHRYDVSDYGVTRDQIRERISGYVARFHV